MDEISSPAEIPRKATWVERLQALVEILLLSGLVSGLLAALVLPLFRVWNMDALLKDARLLSIYLLLESCISLLMLAGLMKLHREPYQNLGFRGIHWKRNLGIGLAIVPFLFLMNGIVSVIFKLYLPQYFLEHNPLIQSVRNPAQLALFVFSALVAGGFKEEVQRAFILNRFGKYLGGAWVGLVVWSLAFGAGHYIQGVQGVVVATMYGFFFGLIYLLSGSLVAPVAAHGAYDALAILAYYFFADKLR